MDTLPFDSAVINSQHTHIHVWCYHALHVRPHWEQHVQGSDEGSLSSVFQVFKLCSSISNQLLVLGNVI